MGAGLTREERKRLKELQSLKAQQKKKKKVDTAQDTIPYKEMYRDGICRMEDNHYSKTIQFYDINYQLAQNEDKTAIFENYCEFLNYFDSSVQFQISFLNHKVIAWIIALSTCAQPIGQVLYGFTFEKLAGHLLSLIHI